MSVLPKGEGPTVFPVRAFSSLFGRANIRLLAANINSIKWIRWGPGANSPVEEAV